MIIPNLQQDAEIVEEDRKPTFFLQRVWKAVSSGLQGILRPAASATPALNGDLVFQLTSNTSLTIKVKGLDGVVRSVSLTLT